MLQQEHHPPHPDNDDEVRVPREKHKVKANLNHWVAAITQNNSQARRTRLTPHIQSSSKESELEEHQQQSPSSQQPAM